VQLGPGNGAEGDEDRFRMFRHSSGAGMEWQAVAPVASEHTELVSLRSGHYHMVRGVILHALAGSRPLQPQRDAGQPPSPAAT
jgi:hypothetical protein